MPPRIAQDDPISEPAAGNAAFAFDLYAALRNETGNLVYSPHSISTALAMTYAGARAETATQMAQTLHFNLPQSRLHPAFRELTQQLNDAAPVEDEAFALSIANSLWLQRDFPLRRTYTETVTSNYGVEVHSVDFIDEAARETARTAVNAWAGAATQGKIEDLIAPGILNESTRLVLANAVYLKAKWAYPFMSRDDEMSFTRLDGSARTVPAMWLGERLRYAAADGYVAVELPYQGERFVMTLIVPDPGRFAAVEAALDTAVCHEIQAGLTDTSVVLSMPKFEVETDLRLKPMLAALGMPIAFDANQADFSGMTPMPLAQARLFIQAVFHKAFLAVDEVGTEAAAATAVVVCVTSSRGDPVPLTVDRPFLFTIHDRESGAILFMGRILDPLE